MNNRNYYILLSTVIIGITLISSIYFISDDMVRVDCDSWFNNCQIPQYDITYESTSENDTAHINFKNVIELNNYVVNLDYINIGIYENQKMISPTIEPYESKNIKIKHYGIANFDYTSVSEYEYTISDFNKNKTIQIVIFDTDGDVNYISHYDANKIK